MREFDVRTALHETELASHRTEVDTLIIDELGLGHGRVLVDIAVINGFIHGYEIKSERDSLERLPKQVSAYSSTLDLATLVVCQNHLERAMILLPPWWGIKIVSLDDAGRVSFADKRPAVLNRHIDAFALACLLWRDEALRLLAPGRKRPRREEQALARRVSPDLRDLLDT